MPFHRKLQYYAGHQTLLSEMSFGQMLHYRNEKGVYNVRRRQSTEEAED